MARVVVLRSLALLHKVLLRLIEAIDGHLARVHFKELVFEARDVRALIRRVGIILIFHVFALNYLEVFILGRPLTTLCFFLILIGPAIVLACLPIVALLAPVLLDGQLVDELVANVLCNRMLVLWLF